MNNLTHLIASPWLMHERMATVLYAQYMTGRLTITDHKTKALLKEGKAVTVSMPVMGMNAPFIGTHSSSFKVKHASGKNVAIMPVIGSLTKRGEACGYGTLDYINEIAALNANEDISAIVMQEEGPGGTVDGTPEFGMAVRNSIKPIVVFGDCMIASANYWVAAQASYIIGNKNNPTEFGSIGVLCVHEYWGKYIEENIGSIRIIRAPQSKDKALANPLEELPDHVEKEMVEDLKGLANSFFTAVKEGRGDALKEDETVWGTGKMYKNAEAIKIGLIDAEGTMEDAINKAIELTAKPKEDATARKGAKQINKPTMNLKQVAKKASSFFKPKSAAKKVAEPAAAEGDDVPMWTADLVFNTDGSGDGAFCLHADTDGTDRKFETKLDNNTGNEPPTDPAITEDDNWSVAPEEEAAAEESEAAEATTVAKMNVALKKAMAVNKTLSAELAKMKATQASNAKKPAASATTVTAKGDKPDARDKAAGKKLSSWEKRALTHMGKQIEE